MFDILSYKITYFVFALFAGFTISYFLTRDSYKSKLIKRLKDSEDAFNKTLKELDSAKKSLRDLEDRHKINSTLYKKQRDIKEGIEGKLINLKEQIAHLEEARLNLNNSLDNNQHEIEIIKGDIDLLKPQYKDRQDIVKEQELLNVTKSNLTKKLNTLQQDISKVSNNIVDMRKLCSEYEDDIAKNILKVKELESEQQILKSRYINRDTLKEDELKDIAKGLQIKILNYKYKIKSIKEQIKKGDQIDSTDIEKFISTNKFDISKDIRG
jgi:chromosome segregation ATPase